MSYHSIQTILKRSKVESTSKPLTLKGYLQKIIQHKLKVTPLIGKDGEIEGWIAAKRQWNGVNHNITENADFVQAPDPVTAVSVLSRRLEERVA